MPPSRHVASVFGRNSSISVNRNSRAESQSERMIAASFFQYCRRFLDFRCRAELLNYSLQVFQTCCDAHLWGNLRCTELHILFYDGPAGISVFQKCAEERREINAALPNDREDLVFDGVFEGPLLLAAFLQHFYIAVFDVHAAHI